MYFFCCGEKQSWGKGRGGGGEITICAAWCQEEVFFMETRVKRYTHRVPKWVETEVARQDGCWWWVCSEVLSQMMPSPPLLTHAAMTVSQEQFPPEKNLLIAAAHADIRKLRSCHCCSALRVNVLRSTCPSNNKKYTYVHMYVCANVSSACFANLN